MSISYRIVIGKYEKYFGDEAPVFRGSFDHVRLDLPSVEAAHSIAKIAGLKSYRIEETQDDWWRSKTVFATDDIIAYTKECEEKANRYNAEQIEKVKRINALPTEFDVKTINDCRFFVKRSEATYDPRRSGRVEYSVDLYYKSPSMDSPRYFYHSEFVTKNGRLLLKAFQKEMKMMFDYDATREDLELFIIGKIVEVQDLCRNA